ncbi:MAG: hypothetical protein A4E46_01829 [Methanosaeta sp. PtaU1.Bin016]|jgi:hypothetical protein|nr:MAG: hypothetical protein A4E46_01829 [Methanosaeta sp. PtaU1.Bin016]
MFKLLAILLLFSSVVQAVVWDEGIGAELHWGEAMILGDYKLVLVDFSPEESRTSQALVELQKDNVTLAIRALMAGESFSLNDSIKVTAQKVVKDDQEDEPYADLTMQLPAAPEVSLLLSSDKDVYQGGDKIRLELEIENSGIVAVEGMKISLTSDPSLVDAKWNRSTLEAGRSWDEDKHTSRIDPIKLNLNAPYLPLPMEFQLKVHAWYNDPEGRMYEAWGGTSFQVAGSLQLHKQVDPSQDFGKGYFVVDTLWNRGNRTLCVTLTDSVGQDFQTDSSLIWKFNLTPDETKAVSYKVFAKKPGEGLVMPSAEASFVLGSKKYKVFSESPVVDVSGPFIEARRAISATKVAPGKEVKILLNLTNSGNRKARVSFQETIPSDAELVGGSPRGTFMINPGEGRDIEYSIRVMRLGEIRLPASEIDYRSVRGDTYSASTPEIAIKVQADKKANISPVVPSQAPRTNEKSSWPGEHGIVYLSLAFILVIWAAFGRYA